MNRQLQYREMFAANPAKQYPNLVEYINFACRPEPQTPQKLTGWGLLGLGAVGSVVALIAGVPLMVLAAAVPALAGTTMVVMQPRAKLNEGEAQRREEIRKVAHAMKGLVEHRRLHRDLDASSLLILEECAHYWVRIRIAFGTGQWQEETLPHSYVSARAAARLAADEGMYDVLLAYRHVLPDSVDGRNPLDYVDEALESFGIKGKVNPSQVPPGFYVARAVADKLRALAEEAERLAFQTAKEMDIRPGKSLDSALSNLRDLRVAEEELTEHVQHKN